MRLFVAVTPPEVVLDQLIGVSERLRPQRAAQNLRWADRSQMHVTLRFLGDVADDALPDLVARLDAAPLVATTATVGPATLRLGRQVLCVPVDGCDALATTVTAATADVGQPPDQRPSTGHVTLARVPGRRGGVVDRSLMGVSVDGGWQVEDVRLIRSHLGSGGSRYEDLHVRPLDA